VKVSFTTYCLKNWVAYVEHKGTLSYKEYLKINKKLLEKQFNDRPKD